MPESGVLRVFCEATFSRLSPAGHPARLPPTTPGFMELQPDDLKRIARLARIAVSDAEIAPLQTQLNGIFGLIDELQAVDTTGLEPLAHPLDVVQHLPQRLREDRITENDQRSANMANAPASENGLFLVPKVIE